MNWRGIHTKLGLYSSISTRGSKPSFPQLLRSLAIVPILNPQRKPKLELAIPHILHILPYTIGKEKAPSSTPQKPYPTSSRNHPPPSPPRKRPSQPSHRTPLPLIHPITLDTESAPPISILVPRLIHLYRPTPTSALIGSSNFAFTSTSYPDRPLHLSMLHVQDAA
jgi:hypothetical protein